MSLSSRLKNRWLNQSALLIFGIVAFLGLALTWAVWAELDRYQRFQILDGLGTEILPVLVALPDVDVEPGTRPTYTERQVTEMVEESFAVRGLRLRDVKVAAAELRVELIGAAVAAAVLWY